MTSESSPAHAYRLLPLDDRGEPLEGSMFVCISDTALSVGDRIQEGMLGHDEWEVVGARPDAGPLRAASDRFGQPLPLRGTLVCRGVRPD